MFRRTATAVLPATLVMSALALVSHFSLAETLSAQASRSVKSRPSANEAEAPPSDAEITARAQKLVSNQHNDDEALAEYERIEHHLDLTAAPNPRTMEDKVYRIVPTGTGTLKIL